MLEKAVVKLVASNLSRKISEFIPEGIASEADDKNFRFSRNMERIRRSMNRPELCKQAAD